VIVVDSAALVDLLVDGGQRGDRVRQRLHGETLAAPDFVKVEAMSAIRGLALGRVLSTDAADDAFEALISLPIVLHPTTTLLRNAWKIRFNVSSYDACYVALATALNATLITNDAKLARAENLPCAIETFL
jgi:predicted nucleic acid-binding protein